MARHLHVGGVAEQGQHALVAQLAQAGNVDHAAGDGGQVDLEVAGVDHGAQGRLDGQGHRVGDAVVHMDELHREAAQPEGGAGLLGKDLGVIQQLMLLQLQLHQGRRQRGGVDGDVQLLEHIGHRADVVLVAVGQDQAPDLLRIGLQIGHVRQHDVHAVHVLIREAHAAVHNDNVAAEFIGGHIFPDFSQTAQGDDLQF